MGTLRLRSFTVAPRLAPPGAEVLEGHNRCFFRYFFRSVFIYANHLFHATGSV